MVTQGVYQAGAIALQGSYIHAQWCNKLVYSEQVEGIR